MTMREVVGVSAAMLALVGCNAGTTAAALVRLEAEMAGARCPHGGIAVLTGLDANSNQALDDEEIIAAQTKYVCNGAPGAAGTAGAEGPAGAAGQAGAVGAAGTNGRNALSVVTAELAGTNCEYGGVRIDVGVDVDGDGQLSTAEITSTRYVCDRASIDAIYFGDITIRDASDVALLAGIQVIAGDLRIESSPTAVFSLPALRIVSGSIAFSGQDGGYIEAPILTGMSFPELVRAGSVYLNYHPTLETISLPKLVRVGSLDIVANPELTSISIPALEKAENFSVRSNASLVSLTAPALRSAGYFDISYNEALTTLGFGALRLSDSLYINNNDALSHCEAYRVLAGLDAEPRYSAYLNGNDETPTCTTADYCRTRTLSGISGTLRQCVMQKAFAAAQSDCVTFGTGAALVWFESAAEWTAFKTAWVDQVMNWDAWVGYSDEAAEGTWVATSGFTGFDPTAGSDFWASGEPNGGASENHAQITRSGAVNDLAGSNGLSFICRVP